MIARLLRIEGRVQGVGYRDWARREAKRRDLQGWVRNRPDASVQILVAGTPEAVTAFIAACRHGPPAAHVTRLDESPSDPPTQPGFLRLPTG